MLEILSAFQNSAWLCGFHRCRSCCEVASQESGWAPPDQGCADVFSRSLTSALDCLCTGMLLAQHLYHPFNASKKLQVIHFLHDMHDQRVLQPSHWADQSADQLEIGRLYLSHQRQDLRFPDEIGHIERIRIKAVSKAEPQRKGCTQTDLQKGPFGKQTFLALYEKSLTLPAIPKFTPTEPKQADQKRQDRSTLCCYLDIICSNIVRIRLWSQF